MHQQTKVKIKKWFTERKTKVSLPQFLLAVEYVKIYDYPIDIACKLALDSYLRKNRKI